MYILNATKSVKSVMADNGDLISVNPGEMSKLIIASRNLIIGAMNLGEPTEIGIILCGSYEMDLTRGIAGINAYVYTDPDEAKSKLMDPSIDYKANLNSQRVNIRMENEVARLEGELKDRDERIAGLKKEVQALKESDELVSLRKSVADLELRARGDADAAKRLEAQLQEKDDRINELSLKLSEVRQDLGAKTQDLTAYVKSNADMSQELTRLRANKGESKEVERLKGQLEEANELVEKVRSEFRGICKRFGIERDSESGEWVMAEGK